MDWKLFFMILLYRTYSIYGLTRAYIKLFHDGVDQSLMKRTVQGFYSIGELQTANGFLLQVHPLKLCRKLPPNEEVNDLYNYIIFVSLEEPTVEPKNCRSPYTKAKRAFKRGAAAVIFDVSKNPTAAVQLQKYKWWPFSNLSVRPVVVIQKKQAQEIVTFMEHVPMANAEIHYRDSIDKNIFRMDESLSTPTSTVMFESNSDADDSFPSAARGYMSIFLVLFLAIITILLLIIIKIKWCKNSPESRVNQLAKQAISQMETKHFKNSKKLGSNKSSFDSNCASCAICLEVYQNGEELRILPCHHEFHKLCVDPWLLANQTCPLCVYDIIEEPSKHKKRHQSPETTPMITECPQLPPAITHVTSSDDIPYDSGPVVFDSSIEPSSVHSKLIQSQSCNVFLEPQNGHPSPQPFQQTFISCSDKFLVPKERTSSVDFCEHLPSTSRDWNTGRSSSASGSISSRLSCNAGSSLDLSYDDDKQSVICDQQMSNCSLNSPYQVRT